MNEDKIATDCTKAAIAAGVNVTPFKGINFLLNDSLVGYALGGQGSVNDGATQLLSQRGLTWLMPWSYGQVPANPDGTRTTGGLGTMEHEMGHAFLLWHSGNVNGVEYKDSWDPMGNPDVGCDPFNPPTTYGCTGQSLTAYDKDFLGWVPTARQFRYAGITRQVTLTPLINGTTGNYLSITVPHTSATTYTVVEMRVQAGIDTRVPGNGVIIHEIDTTNTSISKRITSVNGDADALRQAGQAYAVPGAPAPVNVTVKSVTGNTATVVLSNGIAPAVTNSMGNLTAGSVVTLTDANFSPEATVSFNGTPATTFTVNSSTSITATVPNGTGTMLPTVTNPDGLSGAIQPNIQPGGHTSGTTQNGAQSVPAAHPTGNTQGGPIAPQPTRH